MRRWRLNSLILALPLALALCISGCAPTVLCSVETEVLPDYTCSRVTRIEAKANPNSPGQRPRLSDYFQFPPAEQFEKYTVQPDRVLFAGMFDSYGDLPHDLVRIVPGARTPAGNVMSFRVMDMVLFVLADFDETLTDIVKNQEEGEAALGELLRTVTPEVMAVLKAKYGNRYDLSRLEAWLHNDLPQKLRRLYAGAWAIHGMKRSGVTSPGEDFEFYLLLRSEARREGLELAEPGSPDLQQENIRRLKQYGLRLLEQLCPPRMGGPGVTAEAFNEIAVNDLLASLQQAITARHGSINNFMAKISSLVPMAFGAHLTGTVMPIYLLPEVRYSYRLRLPGSVIQTNGVRELNGDLVWNFMDRDLAFTGQSMWARSIFVREPVVYGLGLRGFPANLGDVDRVFGYLLTPQGTPREALLHALRDGANQRSLAPVEAIAADAKSPDGPAAKGLLELFDNHRKSQAARQRGQQKPESEQPPLPR